MIRILVENGADMNRIVHHFHFIMPLTTALQEAITSGSVSKVQGLLRAEASINQPARGEIRPTPLQHAVEQGNKSVVQFFVEL